MNQRALVAHGDGVNRWITGTDLEGCDVLRGHQEERQRAAGSDSTGSQLCPHQFAVHHPTIDQ